MLTAGTVAAGGAGSGLAKDFYDAWEAAIAAAGGELTGPNPLVIATLCNAMATAIVTRIKNEADVKVPKDSLDSGIPSVDRTLTGAVD